MLYVKINTIRIFVFHQNVLIYDTHIDDHKLQIGFNIMKQIITFENNNNENQTLLFICNMLPNYLGFFCCAENQKIIGGNKNIYLNHLYCCISCN